MSVVTRLILMSACTISMTSTALEIDVPISLPELLEARIESSRPLGADWEQQVCCTETIAAYSLVETADHIVTVLFPGASPRSWRASIPAASTGVPYGGYVCPQFVFTPEPGTRSGDTLRPRADACGVFPLHYHFTTTEKFVCEFVLRRPPDECDSLVVGPGEFRLTPYFEIWNPSTYDYDSAEGIRYVFVDERVSLVGGAPGIEVIEITDEGRVFARLDDGTDLDADDVLRDVNGLRFRNGGLLSEPLGATVTTTARFSGAFSTSGFPGPEERFEIALTWESFLPDTDDRAGIGVYDSPSGGTLSAYGLHWSFSTATITVDDVDPETLAIRLSDPVGPMLPMSYPPMNGNTGVVAMELQLSFGSRSPGAFEDESLPVVTPAPPVLTSEVQLITTTVPSLGAVDTFTLEGAPVRPATQLPSMPPLFAGLSIILLTGASAWLARYRNTGKK